MKNRNLINNLKSLGFTITVDALLVGGIWSLIPSIPLWMPITVFVLAVPLTQIIIVKGMDVTHGNKAGTNSTAAAFDAIYKKMPINLFRAITGRKSK